MNSKLLKSKKFKGLLLVALAAFFIGCGSGGDKDKAAEVTVDMAEISQELFDNISDAKQIFYSLPSPLETAMLVRSAGAEYDAEILNSVDNAGNYTGQKKMALNLGIYTCDLSFASLYDQTQACISYMNAAKQMADGLGILDAISDDTIERLEENVNNREVLLDIVSETFMNSSSDLEETGRPAVAAMLLVGGWIEGLYIATELVNRGTYEGNKLVDRISDQKLSINIVMKLLEENQDNADVAAILAEVIELKNIFDKLVIQTTAIEPEHDPETNVTTLKSESTSTMSPEIFAEISEKIKALRSSYIL